MITEEDAREMMKKLATLRKRAKKSEADQEKYNNYEAVCLESLRYFVEGRTGRYKKFINHSDLTQEGFESLLKAIRTFKLKDENGKNCGSFFFWAGLFVNTKISRSANNHTVIRYPMHIAKIVKPHRENSIPILIDPGPSPETNCEQMELNSAVQDAMKNLNKKQKEIINLAYGFGTGKPMSIAKICEKKKMSRVNCVRIIDGALEILRDKIEV